MKMIMRTIAFALVLMLAAAAFAACRNKDNKPDNTAAPIATDNAGQDTDVTAEPAAPTDAAGETAEPADNTDDASATEPGDVEETGEGDGQGGISDGGDIEIDVPDGEGSGGL